MKKAGISLIAVVTALGMFAFTHPAKEEQKTQQSYYFAVTNSVMDCDNAILQEYTNPDVQPPTSTDCSGNNYCCAREYSEVIFNEQTGKWEGVGSFTYVKRLLP